MEGEEYLVTAVLNGGFEVLDSLPLDDSVYDERVRKFNCF
jgi:hypothetical protein